ncbi:MAG: hypothetical protein H6779_04955 [Candidatus Nomurabacteria bacterium]|nr:hypothetical protein [Candidatus Nomurabacteria bacterium]USN87717.1 MAG: hypothetical protein H6779_04955 [Candidatus Nomurabacteria bacterium]
MKFSRAKKKKTYLAPEKWLIIKQIALGVLLFTLLGLIITGVWYGTRVSSLTISDVTVSDGQTIRAETVKKIAAQELVGEYWHLVPRQFSWFYPQEDIIEKVQEIERIKDVAVERVSGTEIRITFSEYEPDALWCDEDDGECHFLDDRGFAFGKAPALAGESLLRYYKAGEGPRAQENITTTLDYLSTKKMVDLLKDIDWYVNRVEIDAVRDVFYSLSGDSELRASLTDDPIETFDYFQTLIRSEEFTHLKPGNFKYVDLRFGEKLYVNEEVGVEDEVASSTDPVNEEMSELLEEVDEEE